MFKIKELKPIKNIKVKENEESIMTPISEVLDKNEIEKKISFKGKKGGKRPNAGRPKGGENEFTKRKKDAENIIKNRVVDGVRSLIDSQFTLAQGCQYLFRIDKRINKNGREEREKPVLVKSNGEIEAYLRGDFKDSESEYYFITTEKPDIRALDSLFNRVFGKPKETVEMDGNLTIEQVMIKALQRRRGEEEDENENNESNISGD